MDLKKLNFVMDTPATTAVTLIKRKISKYNVMLVGDNEFIFIFLIFVNI